MPIDLDRVYAAMRPGQVGAVKTAIDRILAGYPRTSLVLPPRYGKTDVARVITAYSIDQGKVSGAMFLTVSAGLREQAIATDKWEDCWKRGGITVPIKRRAVKFPEAKYHSNGEQFLALTIQLVQQNIGNFCEWVESRYNATGLPVLVFVDECHTGSEKNTWGTLAARLIECHALVVLLTATAIRSDGEAIEGFEMRVVESKPGAHTAVRAAEDPEHVLVDFLEGERRRIRLIADWETGFREAWREEPSPLCKLSWVPFDVDLMTVTVGLSGAERVGWLSKKSPTEARAILGRVVRDSRVIREGVKRFVREVRNLQATQPGVGGIVFCGNDTESGGDFVNAHAKAILKEIERQDPGLTCLVATSNQGADAVDTVRRFATTNVGDVLIVKQMASIGLDAPRLKVGLDLSPVRQDASCIQRWFRTLTPFNHLRVGVMICVADILAKTILAEWVENEGGLQTHFMGEVVKTIEVPRKTHTDAPVTIVSGTGDADFTDSQLHHATGDQQPHAHALIKAFPELLSTRSHAEIVTKAEEVYDAERQAAGAVLSDLTAEIEAEQDNISAILKDVTTVRYRHRYPDPKAPLDNAYWREVANDAWGEAYRDSGVSYPKGGLRKITDMRALARLKVTAELIRDREVEDGNDVDALASAAS